MKAEIQRNFSMFDSLGRLAAAADGASLAGPGRSMAMLEVGPDGQATLVEKQVSEAAQASVTACVLDISQAVFYLGQAGILIDNALEACPRNSRAACSATVSGIFTSFMWVISYLAFSANDCGESLLPIAPCVGDVTWIAASLGEVRVRTVGRQLIIP